MLQPKRTKFRKAHKGRIHGIATAAPTLDFGQYGLKALEPERVTARQIEAARRALTRHMKRAGPGLDPRLSGRAGVEEADRSAHGLGQGRAGILGLPRQARPHHVRDRRRDRSQVAKEALALAAAKLPIKTRFVERIAE